MATDVSTLASLLPSAGAFGRPTVVHVVLLPGFSMMALASMTEPLRAANLLSRQTLYRWSIGSFTANVPGDIASSSGFRIAADAPQPSSPPCDLLLVVASLDFDRLLQPAALSRLVGLARSSKAVGALSNGSIVLARAGLLDGYRCTVHWERLRELQDHFPATRTTQEVYCIDRDRWTCGGGAAAMDMMLALVRAQHGAALALDVANNFLHARTRWPGEMQPMEVRWRYGVRDRRLAKAIGFMEQSVETPLQLRQLADLAGVSARQLQRLFLAELSRSPEQFYVDLRLRVARGLLEHTAEPIRAIALQCGFGNASHFARAFRGAFGLRPSDARGDP